MGVYKENGKYRARISIGGRRKSLGRYDTKLKAQRAITKYHKEQEAEKAQEAEIQRHLDDLLLNHEQPFSSFYGIEHLAIEPKKPSLRDRVKSIWQNIRQRN